MIDGIRPDRSLVCEVCDDNDHCLPRWEDDGGGMDRTPSLVTASEEGPERDDGHHGRPSDGQGGQSI